MLCYGFENIAHMLYGLFYGYHIEFFFFFGPIWSSEALVITLVSSETCSHLTEHDNTVIAEPEPIPDINKNNKGAVSGRHLYCVG